MKKVLLVGVSIFCCNVLFGMEEVTFVKLEEKKVISKRLAQHGFTGLPFQQFAHKFGSKSCSVAALQMYIASGYNTWVVENNGGDLTSTNGSHDFEAYKKQQELLKEVVFSQCVKK